MKQQLNEIKRMQQLAGIIKENQTTDSTAIKNDEYVGTIYVFDYLYKFIKGALITNEENKKIRDILDNSGTGASKEMNCVVRIDYLNEKNIIKTINENAAEKILKIIEKKRNAALSDLMLGHTQLKQQDTN